MKMTRVNKILLSYFNFVYFFLFMMARLISLRSSWRWHCLDLKLSCKSDIMIKREPCKLLVTSLFMKTIHDFFKSEISWVYWCVAYFQSRSVIGYYRKRVFAHAQNIINNHVRHSFTLCCLSSISFIIY